MNSVISADGTPIAYERSGGQGPPIILTAPALGDRTTMRALAAHLARYTTVINYDRRGRGDSGDPGAYTVAGEIGDLAALIAEAGGQAALYGHSSGAALALHAAAAGLPVTGLVLHEPPFAQDGDGAAARRIAADVAALLAQGRRAEAITSFLTPTGLPAELVARMSVDPAALANAHTLPHDPFEVLSEESRGGRTPEEQARRVGVPALVVCGGAGPPWMIETGQRIAEAMPKGRLLLLPGEGHIVPAEVLGPVLARFAATLPGT
ncbi:alpha/beta fold hydrolase [Nonomuraea sp. SBT364]|uniref:alpha/beta fold hydrolase n=1 Tax=Nonomuraea sp. SBT364 TaxID=1580530 RepID=UPI00066A4B27|nr:alpha/beta hydrolase [Nonomuraea sp. SBT364]